MTFDFYKYTGRAAGSNSNCGVAKELPDRMLAVVCDRYGGAATISESPSSSQYVLGMIANSLASVPQISPTAVCDVVKEANTALLGAAEYAGERISTVGFAASAGWIQIFCAGNAAGYFLKDRKVEYMTSFAESKNSAVGVHNAKNGALGDPSTQFGTDLTGNPVKYKAGDAFMLCSENFCRYITNTEIEIDLSKSKTAEEWAKFMLTRLFLKGHVDDQTVICGIVKPDQTVDN